MTVDYIGTLNSKGGIKDSIDLLTTISYVFNDFDFVEVNSKITTKGIYIKISSRNTPFEVAEQIIDYLEIFSFKIRKVEHYNIYN